MLLELPKKSFQVKKNSFTEMAQSLHSTTQFIRVLQNLSMVSEFFKAQDTQPLNLRMRLHFL